MEKIYAEMKSIKVIYIGEKSGTAKVSGKPYKIKQVQAEQTRRDGLKVLHLMTLPQFNITPIAVGDVIDADICCRAAGGNIYLDLTEHRVLSTEQKTPLKAMAGGK